MSELLNYVSFQRRICENQLRSYNKILNESHPKYILLKEEYNFYLLMENIVKSLENQNVTTNQIDDATKSLEDVLNQFKTSLSTINEAGIFDKTKKFFRGLTTGHDINVLEKEKSIENFTRVYQSFKPLIVTVNILDQMFQKQTSGYEINSEKLKSLKLGGSLGNELKTLILNAASSEDKLEKLKAALPLVQNYGQGSTNPILSNFIPEDLVKNTVDVGVKAPSGAAQLRGHGSNKPTDDWAALNKELGGDEEPAVVGKQTFDISQQLPTDDEEYAGSGSIFGGHALPKEQTPTMKTRKALRGSFRDKATAAGIPTSTVQWMVKSGLAKWASENPDQFMNLAKQLTGTLAENKNKIVKFIDEQNKQKQLVTEVVNKWNKLAGIK